jgi:hypothetical protein
MLAALVACGAAYADAKQDRLPPGSAVAGWTRQGEARSFTPKNLWEYIDGEADLFLAYGFAGLETAQYAKADDAERSITVDVYDMGAPLNAYGVFSSERGEGAKPVAVGAQGYAGDGLVAFWRGSYYVKIATMDTGDAEAALSLAAATAERLRGTSELPSEFKRLPAKDRISGSERYVRKDALGHKALTNVVSADYRAGKALATLHLAHLLDGEKAKQAWQKLRDFEGQAGEGLTGVSGIGEAAFAVRDSSYGKMVVARQGRFVVIAAGEKSDRTELSRLANNTLRLNRQPAASRS